jgi:uncharacterized protein (DUF2062 family)
VKVFDRALWKPTRNTLAGGVALGLVVSMLPPVPVQMLIAVALAIFLRINIPAAAAGCWFSNPVTWGPLIWAQHKIGVAILPTWDALPDKVESLRCYTMGAIVMGLVLGIGGYFLTRFIWDIVMWAVERRRRAKAEAERAAMEKRAVGK